MISPTIQLPLSNDQPMSSYNKLIRYTPLVPTCDNDPSCPCQHARPHQAQGKWMQNANPHNTKLSLSTNTRHARQGRRAKSSSPKKHSSRMKTYIPTLLHFITCFLSTSNCKPCNFENLRKILIKNFCFLNGCYLLTLFRVTILVGNF